MGCGSSGATQQVSSNQPPPQVLAAYQNLVGQGQSLASQPLQQYPLGPNASNVISGFTPQQQQGFSAIQGASGLAQPYIGAAAGEFGNATQPLWPTLPQFSQANLQPYMSPYTKDVTSSLQNLFNEQNAEQLQQVKGNATTQGAYGGDREAVAEAETARQQGLAENPALAQVVQQGYNTGLGAFQQQQQTQLSAEQANAWLASQAGFGLGQLGQESLGTTLQGANANIGAGAMQQGLAQEQLNAPYEQFLQRQAYPYQQLNFLGGLTEGTGSLSGGTSSGTMTPPSPSTGSQVAGGALTAAMIAAMFLKDGGRVGLAAGGLPGSPTSDTGLATPGVPNLNYDFIVPSTPQVKGAGPPSPAAIGQPSQGDQTMQAMQEVALMGGKKPRGSTSTATNQASNQAFGRGMTAGREQESLWGPRDPLLGPTMGKDYLESPGVGINAADLSGLTSQADWNIASGAGGLQRGGRPGFQMGGAPPPAVATQETAGDPIPTSAIGMSAGALPMTGDPSMGASPVMGQNPNVQGAFQQISQLPTEKLQEMAVRMPPGSTYGRLIQRALMMRHMQPQQGLAQPQQSAANDNAGLAQPMVANARWGGRTLPKRGHGGMTPLDWSGIGLGVLGLANGIGEMAQPEGSINGQSAARGGRMHYADGGDTVDPSYALEASPDYIGEGPGLEPGLAGPPPEKPPVPDGATDKSGGFHLSDNARTALLMAGLGMMGSRSPYFGQAVGEGGMRGLQTYAGLERQDRQAGLQQQRIASEEARNKALEQHYADMDKRSQVDHSGPTVRIFHPSTGEYIDTGIPSESALQNERTAARDKSTAAYQQGELEVRREANRIAEEQKGRGYWEPSAPVLGPDGKPKLDEKSGAPLYTWTNRYDASQTRQGPYDPQVGSKGKGETASQWKYDAWLAAHPDDKQGALDFVAGHKQMGEGDVIKSAHAMAQSEFKTLFGSGERPPPKDAEAWLTERQAQYESQLRAGRPAQAQPGGGSAADPLGIR